MHIVDGRNAKTIVAGYPWFTDWGRDTFIALRGLCLATGRVADARDILIAWANSVSEGMLPNRFPDRGETPEYNTVDATLWFFEAARALGDDEFVRANLLPVFRGILSTIYVQPAKGASADAMRGCLHERYAAEPFVRVYDKGLPELRCVQHTNECHIAIAANGPVVVIVAAIDNLVKGASGQALQNMNLMLSLPETEGLR